MLAVPSFAERLREVGAQLDREVRSSMEASVQNAQHEARMLRDEVEWLQWKLEDEVQQSAMRLGLCSDLKQRISEMQESLQQEASAREYWQRECNLYEERYSLLEAKLEGLMLTHQEQTGMPLDMNLAHIHAVPSPGAHKAVSSTKVQEASKPPRATSSAAAGNADEGGFDIEEEDLNSSDEATVERYLGILESGAFRAALDKGLQRLSVDGLHTLLVAAAARAQSAGVLVHRVIQLWVGRLLSRKRGQALQVAVHGGSQEALAALLGLGGPSVLALEAAEEGAPVTAAAASAGYGQSLATRSETAAPCLLSLCVERRDVAMLAQLLEQLRGARSGLGLSNVRKALALAEHMLASDTSCHDLVLALSSHLVVELSHLGNAQYRHADLDAAISSYEEAILLCDKSVVQSRNPEHACASGGGSQDAVSQSSESTRENMVRLRYNLARTLHRSDRWAEARLQASEVIALDHAYVNAYALRAQAAMAGCDWQAALADWDALMDIIASGSIPGAGTHTDRGDLVVTWRKRREECITQLALGHYEVLALRRMASIDEVRQAYRDVAKQWHPDKHSHRSRDLQERACRRFERIRQAYDVLGDEAAKQAYDASLLLSEARPLMTGQGVAASTRGEKLEMKTSESSDKPPPCPSPTKSVRRTSTKSSVTPTEMDGEDLARRPSSSTRSGNIRSSRTDSPTCRSSPRHSPLSGWLPSFNTAKSPDTVSSTTNPSIHINLFDSKFADTDVSRDAL